MVSTRLISRWVVKKDVYVALLIEPHQKIVAPCAMLPSILSVEQITIMWRYISNL